MSTLLSNIKFVEKINQNEGKTLFITNKNSFNLLPVKNLLENNFKGPMIRVTEFDLNPTVDHVLKLIKHYAIQEFQNFNGIGGGSAMDMAKILFYFSHFQKENITEDLILKELDSASLPSTP